jgi:hypothetical protein
MIIDRTQTHDRVALPGDPTLDYDLESVVITAVVAIDGEQKVLIHLQGSHGRWTDSTTGETATINRISHVNIRARIPDMPPTTWRSVVDQLQRWRDSATPLWFGAAPGKVFSLIEDPNHYVFLPRRPDPAETGAA